MGSHLPIKVLPPTFGPTDVCKKSSFSKYSRCTLVKNFYALYTLYQSSSQNIKWYFTVGCDTYVNVPNLLSVLSAYDPTQPHLIGQCWDTKVEDAAAAGLLPGSKYANGGGGIAISAALMDAMIPKMEAWMADQSKTHNSDLSIAGLAAAVAGASCVHSDAFHGYSPRWYAARPVDRQDPWGQAHPHAASFHYMSPDDMFQLDQSLALESIASLWHSSPSSLPALSEALVREHYATLSTLSHALRMCESSYDLSTATASQKVSH